MVALVSALITPAMVRLYAKALVVKKYQFAVALWSVPQWNAMVLVEMERITDDDARIILKYYKGMKT